MKKFIIGLIVGLCIASSIVFADNQIVANITNFPILIDGDSYTPKNSVMVINDTSYISSKDVGKISGKSVNWNESLKRIEFGENNSSYKFENLKFENAGIGIKTEKYDDKFKPQDGNGFVGILVKITNTGDDAVCLNKKDFYIQTFDGEKFSNILSPADNFFSVNLHSKEYNTIGLLFEIPKDDIIKKRNVTLIYKPTEAKSECKIPINLTLETN